MSPVPCGSQCPSGICRGEAVAEAHACGLNLHKLAPGEHGRMRGCDGCGQELVGYHLSSTSMPLDRSVDHPYRRIALLCRGCAVALAIRIMEHEVDGK